MVTLVEATRMPKTSKRSVHFNIWQYQHFGSPPICMWVITEPQWSSHFLFKVTNSKSETFVESVGWACLYPLDMMPIDKNWINEINVHFHCMNPSCLKRQYAESVPFGNGAGLATLAMTLTLEKLVNSIGIVSKSKVKLWIKR